MSDVDRMRLGWWLSSEEHDPRGLVAQAVMAERIGVDTVMISDHLQPWVPAQGHSSHVWSVIGAIAQATDRLEIGTGVVAFVYRNDPITIAQAAATAAILLEGRFFLGVGAGERLNEQPFGRRWPRAGERRDRLGEAIAVMRRLWDGDSVNHRGEAWKVENLRLMSRPAQAPQILVAASGARTATLAGEIGDGLIGVTPDAQLANAFAGAGGRDKPCVAQLHVSLAATHDEAVDSAFRWWPNSVVPPSLLGELAKPAEFEAAAAAIGPSTIANGVVCAADAAAIVAAIDRFAGAGYGTVYVHQVGPDQERLADMMEGELLPHYRSGQ